ncbi:MULTISPECIES: ABC transporter permease [Nocardiopsis]|uniref:ABC transporter n=1 Tax=Nocardiopsis sinuspersici TaxID=501010 RepID=A0A1V3C4H0_9ACTN|nr:MULTISPECIES: ABC transporter permease [Nocardiopsis]OOC55528.1 ABC transporter [Nocardiopsis sinuspersici]
MTLTAVNLELRKTRRLRVVLVCAVMVAAVVALTCANLMSDSARAGFDDPGAQPWESLLMSYVMVTAMTSPLLVAVLASRQVDIEHQGQGWMLSQVAGLRPGRLCRAKATVLGALLAVAVPVQTALVVMAGLAAGITVPLSPGVWVQYAVGLLLVDLALLCLHVWLAARVENQLVGMGVGLLGAFCGVFSLLMPPALARVLPWGYYAVVSPLRMGDDGFAALTPGYGWLAVFLAVVAVLFAVAGHRFDRTEA